MEKTRTPVGAAGWLWVYLAVAAMGFSLVHTLVGLGIREGCWRNEVLAGWPDGVRCTLGWRQWPYDTRLLASLWFGASLCRRSTRGQSHPCSAGSLLCLQGHETHFGPWQLAGNGGQHYHHAGLRDSDCCSASIAEQRLRRLVRISEARAARAWSSSAALLRTSSSLT